MTELCRERVLQWLWDSADRGASDLHLVAGYPPIRREHGELIPLQEEELDAIVVRDTLCDLPSPEV